MPNGQLRSFAEQGACKECKQTIFVFGVLCPSVGCLNYTSFEKRFPFKVLSADDGDDSAFLNPEPLISTQTGIVGQE